tara:strand:- start:33 stop:353 length:321 start_codon:yes stop_codon:yes gene_type:complete
MKKKPTFNDNRKQRKKVKDEINEIKKSIPGYLVGFAFFMVLIINALENKVYSYFGGSLNFFKISGLFTVCICIIYLYLIRKKIQKQEKKYKKLSLKLHVLMKLENE